MHSSSPGYTVCFALSGERSCPQLRFLYTSISIIRIIPHQHDQRHLPGDSKFLPSWQSTPVITSESPYIPVSVLCLPTLVLVCHFGSWPVSSQWVALDPSSWFSCGQICCSYLLCCIYPPHTGKGWKVGWSMVCVAIQHRSPISNCESSNHKHACCILVVRYEHACTHAFW